ncbi:NADH:ubiquinone reductase (Na(+)-transporting) subunit B [Desulfobulbus rhabdoformis]|uniref:NADH:ubiquinone reductase (Na(+)-transporting) subunit B n=1 Tax=Desulfobulbus rhabdoformis TaxID=34032 RepID=UPI001964E12E|nr:NADH:ubiquinone reductase (Na(+)-transporting) subunit B [Desulfobulbus rhabdoformis]MBM9616243.1 NADH:ubiquinone reductase (Na(+)-transporting) subunit B [Desulfobulbus rhabdoformis]
MKFLRDIFDKLEPRFTKGGPWHRWYALFEATDSFLFHSRRVTHIAPHVRDAVDYKRIMITVIIALIPCVIMALWNTGYQANSGLQQLGLQVPPGWRGAIMAQVGCDPNSVFSNMVYGALYFLPIYLVTVVVGSLWEGLFNLIRGHEISEAFLVTSLLFPLTLPPTIPLWQVALGISFGIIFAKEVFGGVGRNFMNPALVSRAFLYFAYPISITGDAVWVPVDGLTSATPLAHLAASPTGFSPSDLSLSWTDAFVGIMPGSMGETSALACLLGAAFLLYTGIASWRIMGSMVLGGGLAALLLANLSTQGNGLQTLPAHWHLVLGGFAFGMVFMATDPVSAAQTPLGQWIYGLLIGILAIVIRVANPAFPEGVMLAILLGNVCAPLLDHFVIQANIKRRRLRHG